MTPNPMDLNALPPTPNWTIRLPSPEESERMLREEPRFPAEEVMAELQEMYGMKVEDGK